MKAVTGDANVLASGFVGKPATSPPAAFLNAWQAQLYTLVLSDNILTELAHTFIRPYFRQRLTAQEAADDLALLRQRARIIPITVTVQGVATHPEDDLVLATALRGNVDYLVTGDGNLHRLGSYQSITIVTPRHFVDVMLLQLNEQL